jgi:hypothetical protein
LAVGPLRNAVEFIIYSLKDGKAVKKITCEKGEFSSMFVDNHKVIALVNGIINIWDVKTGNICVTLN